MKLISALILAFSMVATPAFAGPGVDLWVNKQQRAAAHTGLAFGLTTQGFTLTTTLVWALGGDVYGALLPISVGTHIANLPMSVAGIAGFEGTMRDGTVAGRHRGLGTGFLEGGLYSVGMGALLLAGNARHYEVDCAVDGPDGEPACFEDVTFLFAQIPAAVYFAVGGVYTALGAGFLGSAARGDRASAVRLMPTFAGGPGGFQAGVVGVF